VLVGCLKVAVLCWQFDSWSWALMDVSVELTDAGVEHVIMCSIDLIHVSK
jgi:hypothetical protein